jgi:hypothetical protein
LETQQYFYSYKGGIKIFVHWGCAGLPADKKIPAKSPKAVLKIMFFRAAFLLTLRKENGNIKIPPKGLKMCGFLKRFGD